MGSLRPKPLHLVNGTPMIVRVVAATEFDAVTGRVLVVGHQAAWVERSVRETLPSRVDLHFATQYDQLGTGHAVLVAMDEVATVLGASDGDVLIVPGDCPLLRADSLRRLVDHHRASGAALTLLTATLDQATGYGRIIRDSQGDVTAIVEERDASEEQREIREINTSVMIVRASVLREALEKLGRNNAQGEYYLTDVVAILREAGRGVEGMPIDDTDEVLGVNTREQLAAVREIGRRRTLNDWSARGVTFRDASTVAIDDAVKLAAGVVVGARTILQGNCQIGQGALLGPDVNLRDSLVGARARVEGSWGALLRIAPGSSVVARGHLAPGEHLT